MSVPPTPQDSPHGSNPSPGAGGHAPPPPPGDIPQQPAQGGQGGHQPPPPPQGGYQQQPPQGGYQQQPQQGSYQAAPGPQYVQADSSVGQPAELLDRFLARLIDYVILFVFNMLVVGFLIIGVFMSSSAGMFGMGGGNFLASVVSSVLFAAIYLGYFAYLESSRGQTVGKMVMKLETRGPGGGRPTMEQALRRNAWVALGILGVIPVIGGVLGGLAQLAAMILIAVGISGDTAGRRGWHDTFAGGTQVVKIG